MSNVGDTWSTGISRALSVGTQMCVFAQESSVALSGEALDTHFSSSSTLPPRQAPYTRLSGHVRRHVKSIRATLFTVAQDETK